MFEVWSLDVERCSVVMEDCDACLEIRFRANGESEGLAFACTLGGLLHYQIAPRNEEFLPTYWTDPAVPDATGRTAIVSFLPTGANSCSPD